MLYICQFVGYVSSSMFFNFIFILYAKPVQPMYIYDLIFTFLIIKIIFIHSLWFASFIHSSLIQNLFMNKY